jgi:hypothetical protein
MIAVRGLHHPLSKTDISSHSKEDFMKFAMNATIAVAASVFAQFALAQASAPVSRADVKAETRAAEKAGKLAPAGEGSAPMEKSTEKSTKTRAERKAETAQARKEGKLAPAGSLPDYPKDSKSKGTTTRAERKAETKAAVKARETVPAGEGPTAPTK